MLSLQLHVVLVILSGIKRTDGTPYVDMQKAAGTIPWDVIWLLVASTPLAAAFNAEESTFSYKIIFPNGIPTTMAKMKHKMRCIIPFI